MIIRKIQNSDADSLLNFFKVRQLFIEEIDVAVRTRTEVADCPADDL